ncbi:pyridine nucleotide-disulfide oxidoreductase [Paracoccus sp. M683]|uniref:NAD(P)/FAD-dependent oxidoreductase n=1 Tax=Paracoccus sp. M683 TaxID=2594268 RepID=UPI00117EDB01|nr:FAD-dependent oxidoreductase [Paracoccus sp. M683]TRW95334.1 pyridine nucleotide-disulfide oxidoreductase [Paracoccus sp. M683]
MTNRAVIIGAGQGGFQAAMSLRQEGYAGVITLIGAEPGLPYQRPPLSKAYLKSGEADKLTLRPASFFEKNAVDLHHSTTVDAIDRKAQVVRAGGRDFAYDHLILATGTRNLRPPIPGLDRALDLRSLRDAARLRAELDRPRRVAVIGGGFIGLEFAAVARALGHHVTVAEAAERLMARVLSPEMSARFLDMHRSMGTVVHLGQPVTEVTADGIALADGTCIAADLLLLAAGVVPNTELARDAGLTVENGIVVDAMLSTSDPAISALGDCAVFPDPRTGQPVRLESVQAATDHARAIARRLVHGARDAYAAVPWFWSDQSDWKLQIAGLAGPGDSAHQDENGAVWRFDGEVLTAVETINDAKTHMKVRRLMAQSEGQPILRSSLAAEAGDLIA